MVAVSTSNSIKEMENDTGRPNWADKVEQNE